MKTTVIWNVIDEDSEVIFALTAVNDDIIEAAFLAYLEEVHGEESYIDVFDIQLSDGSFDVEYEVGDSYEDTWEYNEYYVIEKCTVYEQ